MNNRASRANAVACRLDRPVRPLVFFGRWAGGFGEHRARSIPNTALFEHATRATRQEQPFDYRGPHTLTARRSAPARSANHYLLKTFKHFAMLPRRRVLKRQRDRLRSWNCASRSRLAVA